MLAALSAAAIHIINKIIYCVSTIDNLLHKDSGNDYEWRFGKIHYKKIGEGKPLLLIHDLSPVGSSYEWSRTIHLLAKNHTVYAVDLLGCGASDKPNLTYTNFLYVQMLSDFIKNVIGEPVDIAATGKSAPLAVMTCTSDQYIIDKIILINPQNLSELAKIPTKRTKLLYHFINLPLIGTLLYNTLFTRRRIASLFETEFYYDVSLVDENAVNTYNEAAHSDSMRSRHLFASLKGGYVNVNLTQFLPAITHSIFIVTGSGNPLYTEDAALYQRYLPSIEIVSIARTRHLPQLEKPEEFAEQIEILLDPK